MAQQRSQALERRQAAVKDTVTRVVGDDNAPLFERAGIDPAVFERVVLNAMLTTPKIAECEPKSIERALLRCVMSGLQPDAHDAVLIPFSGEATLVPMVDGEMKLARQATPGLTQHAAVVYKDEHFIHIEGLEPRLEHTPNPELDRSDERIIAAYAVIRGPGWASPEFEVLYRADLDTTKARSPSGNKKDGPWTKHFKRMCIKTALKLVLQRAPKSATAPPPPPPGLEDFDRYGDVAVTGYIPDTDSGLHYGDLDGDDDDGEDPNIVDAEVVEPEPEPAKKAPAKKKAAAKKAAAKKKAAAAKADPADDDEMWLGLGDDFAPPSNGSSPPPDDDDPFAE